MAEAQPTLAPTAPLEKGQAVVPPAAMDVCPPDDVTGDVDRIIESLASEPPIFEPLAVASDSCHTKVDTIQPTVTVEVNEDAVPLPAPSPNKDSVAVPESDKDIAAATENKEAANEGQGDVNQQTTITQPEKTLHANQQIDDMQKNFVPKKKRYAGFTGHDIFEQKILRIFLNCWMDS
ncbi:hypothetical protein [Bartonella sp. AP72JLCBS]|uniref:hypothetical protein n=1 Tax=Bartonella sp. AP72JLCBS TaxID=3243502 RepID=UPI0035CFDDEA